MQKKLGITTVILTLLTLVFVMASFANVLPPPANQKIGIPDSVFSDLQEDDCRFCHDNPDIVQPPEGNPNPSKWNVDRHHLRYGQPLEEGFCSVSEDICNLDDDCNPNICSLSGKDCTSDECGESEGTCGEQCVGGSVAPLPPAPDDTYECTTCHPILTNGTIEIIAVRDCLFCHDSSPHHTTSEAQSQNCQFCHGDLVNNIGDDHIIPTYDPSLVTPNPSGGNGEPANVEGNGAGACNYCHSTGTGQAGAVQPGIVSDPEFLGPFGGPVNVYRNDETHHGTGLGTFDSSQCLWCHNIDDPGSDPIRRCEGCHGFESLHNICVDSDDADDVCSPAEENPGWSHVGNNNDCWGCHGFSSFSASSAPAMGPIIPYIDSSSVLQALSGTDTDVTLTGTNFQNTVDTTTYACNVTLTSEDGTSFEIIPTSISPTSLTFIIPASTAQANYDVRCNKAGKESNPVTIAVIPDVTIDSMICSGKRTLTITGSDFGERDPGTENYIYVEAGGVTATVTSWTDSEIKVAVPNCTGTFTAVVSALFGTETEVCDESCAKRRIRR